MRTHLAVAAAITMFFFSIATRGSPALPSRVLQTSSTFAHFSCGGYDLCRARTASVSRLGFHSREFFRRYISRIPPSQSHFLGRISTSARRTAPLACSGEGNDDGTPATIAISPLLFPLDLGPGEILPIATSFLDSHGVTEPFLSSSHLLTYALGLAPNTFSRLSSRENADMTLSEDQREIFVSHLSRRSLHEPLQYILGSWDFMDFEIKCRAPTLCPRPETEELVEKVLERMIPEEAEWNVLDVGCGTGCIGLAIARHRPRAKVVGIDVSSEAVKLSNDNAAKVLVGKGCGKYVAVRASAREFGRKTCHLPEITGIFGKDWDARFDIVVANPPYIPSNVVDGLGRDVIDYEDRGALDGGATGLDVIAEIFSAIPMWTAKEKGCDLFMEVDTSHPKLLERMFAETNFDYTSMPVTFPKTFLKDLIFMEGMLDFSGKDRFVWLRCEP